MKKSFDKLHTQLFFNNTPVFTSSDISLVMTGLKFYDMNWIMQRKSILENPTIADFVKGSINA